MGQQIASLGVRQATRARGTPKLWGSDSTGLGQSQDPAPHTSLPRELGLCQEGSGVLQTQQIWLQQHQQEEPPQQYQHSCPAASPVHEAHCQSKTRKLQPKSFWTELPSHLCSHRAPCIHSREGGNSSRLNRNEGIRPSDGCRPHGHAESRLQPWPCSAPRSWVSPAHSATKHHSPLACSLIPAS